MGREGHFFGDLQQRIGLGGEDEADFVLTVDLVDPDGEAGLSKCPSQFLACKAMRANYHKRMPTKTMCALVALLFCFSAIAADKKPLTPAQIKLARDARGVLGEYCGKCHGRGGANIGKMELKHERLLEKKFVVPGNPGGSDLYTIIEEGEMPPEKEQNKVPQEKLDIIKEWIEGGAPPWPVRVPRDPPITHQDMAGRMLADLKKQVESGVDPLQIRYFTLSNLVNAGEQKDDMHNYRTALSKLVNSLSWDKDIHNPISIDDGKAIDEKDILRINLDNYDWKDDTWDEITLKGYYRYPYTIDYPYPAHQQLRQMTKAEVPYIRADWFIAHGAKPELYHEILKLPDTDRELEEDKLNLNVDKNIEDGVGGRFQRAGFLKSGVSKFNRIVERHKSGHGSYWKSYDFSSNKNRQNIFRFPLGPDGLEKENGDPLFHKDQVFKQAGGEIIFTLPNGLQGYFLVDSEGDRLDVAPIEIVQNLAGGAGDDPQISNGLSCMTCHTRGMQPFKLKADHLRKAIANANSKKVFRNFGKARALKLLAFPKVINDLVDKDSQRFEEAVKKTGGVVGDREPIALLANHYESALDKFLAAGELGVTVAELEWRTKASKDLQEYGLYALFVDNGSGLARESWEENYKDIYFAVSDPEPIVWYRKDGSLEYEGFWAEGKLMRATTWDTDGNQTGQVLNGMGKLTVFYENGKKQQEGTFNAGKLSESKFWNGKGELVNAGKQQFRPFNTGDDLEFPFTFEATFNPDGLNPGNQQIKGLAWTPERKGKTIFSSGIEINQKFNRIHFVGNLLKWDSIRWQPRFPKPPVVLNENVRITEKIALNPDSRKNELAVLSRVGNAQEKSLEIFDLKPQVKNQNKNPRQIGDHFDNFEDFAWSPDGDKLAVITRDKVIVFNSNGKQLALRKFQFVAGKALPVISLFRQSLDWSPDGKMLAILFSTGVQIWDWQLLGDPDGNGGPFEVLPIGFAIDWGPLDDLKKEGDLFDSKIAIGSNNGTINIVQIGFERNPANNKIIKVNKHVELVDAHDRNINGRVVTVLWSPDGRRLASGTNSFFRQRQVNAPNEIKIWDTGDFSREIQVILIKPRQIKLGGQKLRLGTNVFSLAWRADKRFIAAGLDDGTVRVFNKIK